MTVQEEVAGTILGPFTDMVQRVVPLVWDTATSNVPGVLRPRTLLLTAFIGILIFLIRPDSFWTADHNGFGKNYNRFRKSSRSRHGTEL